MQSGIFAVVNIGQLRLYIGQTHQLKERWGPILKQLDAGTCKHMALQSEWEKYQGQRKVTFHTMADLRNEKTLLRYKQFVKDVKGIKESKSKRGPSSKD